MDKSKDQTPTRVSPRGGATRCPFCHDECEPEGQVVVCRSCLSRHHAACWGEGSACSSCGASEYLGTPAEGELLGEAEPQRTWLGMTKGEIGLWVLLVATSAFILGVVQSIGAFEKMFEETGTSLPLITQLVLTPAKYPMLAALAVIAWVATAAMARKHRKAFVSVVLIGVMVSIPLLAVALFLPLITIIEKL